MAGRLLLGGGRVMAAGGGRPLCGLLILESKLSENPVELPAVGGGEYLELDEFNEG
jgi:hypothetical protein